MLLLRLFLGSALLLAAACATKPPASDPDAVAEFNEANDPLEPTNRVFYAINNGIDTVLLRPVAIVYRQVPGAIRRPVHNLLTNMNAPVGFANNVLQAHPRKAGDMMMRFLINSTVGVGGLFDVATDWGYPDNEADFGLTMAVWGVGSGPFLFLPVLGPSNPRDATGFAVDVAADPLTWIGFDGSQTLAWSRLGLSAADTRERYLDQIDNIKKTALDPYATFRSLYRQNREEKINRARQDRPATIPAWFPQPATPAAAPAQ